MPEKNSKYNTVEKVHLHALEAIGKPMIELNNGKPLKGKSGPGDAFETWFDKVKDSASEPDMQEAGVELKATPIRRLEKKKDSNGNAQYSSKERLVLNIINYDELASEAFEDSHFLHKNSVIELGFYEYLPNVSKNQWKFKSIVRYEMAKDDVDFQIIKNDWLKIQQYVLDGKAEEINEGMTDYLAACTKGTNAKSLRSQPFSDVRAKQRAFSLKSGYMTSLLRTSVLGDKPRESIFKGKLAENVSLEEAILSRLAKWQGRTSTSLRDEFNLEGQKVESLRYKIASRMLGLEKGINNGSDAKFVTEFEKGNIVPKTVAFEESGVNKESTSFPPFKFKDLAQQTWNDSDGVASADWHVFLRDSKLLLLVFQTAGTEERFMGAKFFKVPEADLEGPIRKVWQDTVDKLNEGVELKAKPTTDKRVKSGYKVENNFLGVGDRLLCHVRPHARVSSYTKEVAGGNRLPVPAKWVDRPDDNQWFSDDWMTTQSFWLNKEYIRKQVKDLLYKKEN